MAYKYFSTENLFKRHKYAFPKTATIKYFLTLSPYHVVALGVFELSIHQR